MAVRSRERRLRPALRFGVEKRLKSGVRIDRRRAILHQTSRVSRWTVVAVQVASEHAQHGHLLTLMVRRVRQPARHDPRLRSADIEERRRYFPPAAIGPPQRLEAFAAVFRVALHELDPYFALRKRRRTDIDAQHAPKPGVLADALMHHVLVHAASARIRRMRPHWKILVPELAPDAQDFEPLGLVALD